MSLQVKFSILLASLAVAVLLALAVARWTLDVTYREIREPIQGASAILRRLVDIEKQVDQMRALSGPREAFRSSPGDGAASTAPVEPPAAQSDPLDAGVTDTSPGAQADGLTVDAFLPRERLILELLGEIEAETGASRAQEAERWAGFTGRSATKNLRAKVAEARDLCRVHLGLPLEPPVRVPGSDEPPDPRSLITPASATANHISAKLFQIHELLKKMEDQVVEDLEKIASAGADLRARLGLVLGLSLLLVALTGGLGFLLMRRWVVHPVATLRTAAGRIAAGDFDYRIPIASGAGGVRDEIGLLSAEVNHMAGMVAQMQTERVEQERLAAIGEMVRRLAHNLRNPLSGIRSLAELTRSEAHSLGAAAGDVIETQTRIITTLDRFEGWLADLLNVTKPTQLHVEPTDTARWLSGLVEAHRALAQSRGVRLELDQSGGPGTAEVDVRHLEHAVSAILSNAIEAAATQGSAASGTPNGPTSETPNGGVSPAPRAAPFVQVSSRRCEAGQEGPIWEMRIVDNGPGVAPDLRASIFKPYFTTKPDGNGIGLAVAQQVVRAHRGRIDIEDAANADPGGQNGTRTAAGRTGAAFIIRIPLEDGPPTTTEVARIGQ